MKQKLNLLESLFEDAEEEIINDETPECGANMGIASLIIDAINDEWEAIKFYNDMIATVDEVGDPNNVIDVVRHIVAEENNHVGQLEELLGLISPNVENIDAGREELNDIIQGDEINA